MIKIELKTIYDEVAFTHESDNNTIKETVEKLLKDNIGKLIRDIDLSNLDLSKIRFDNSCFDNSRFDKSRFDKSRFDKSRFDNSCFDNSSFDNSSFDNSCFDNSSFYNSRFYNSRFDNSRFDNSCFDNSSFDNSSFDNIPVKKLAFIKGLYKYVSGGIISTTGEKYIKLGCHTRIVEEWEKDFWNNNKEFPNDNSDNSKLRVAAFEYWKKWLKRIDK